MPLIINKKEKMEGRTTYSPYKIFQKYKINQMNQKRKLTWLKCELNQYILNFNKQKIREAKQKKKNLMSKGILYKNNQISTVEQKFI